MKINKNFLAKYLDNEALSLITSFLPAPESADLVAGLEEKDRTIILENLPDDVVTDLIQETDEDHQQEYEELYQRKERRR